MRASVPTITALFGPATSRDVVTTEGAPSSYCKMADVVASTPVKARSERAVTRVGVPKTIDAKDTG